MPGSKCKKCRQDGGSPAERLVMGCINDNRENPMKPKNGKSLDLPTHTFYKISGGSKKRPSKKRSSKKRKSSKKK